MTTYGRTFTRRTLRPAKGTKNGSRKMAVTSLDPDEFDRISRIAWKQGISMAELVRRVLKNYSP